MTAASIGGSKAGGYARYLESKTLAPELGDYYLDPGGEPVQAPGRWLSSPGTLARLGIEGEEVDGREFIALMEGRHPRSGEWLRRVGADGSRGGGIDLTFSAPKSVSITWALGDHDQRRQVEAAYAAAVRSAIDHLRETVPAIRRRRGGQVVEQPASDLIAAEYRHTTARGVVDGDAPDPQLHSHIVVSSALRDDGRIVAIASRPLFRAGRELGAYYRSALAHELAERGYRIESGTGKDGRYFEIAGVQRSLIEAFSARSREVARAAERFRAEHGRAPDLDELRRIKLENRKQKIPVTQADLRDAWHQTALRHDFHAPQPQRDREPGRDRRRQQELARERAGQLQLSFERPSARDRTPQVELTDRVEARLTEQAATFTPGELRAVLLEQSVGDLTPEEAIGKGREMIEQRRILPLEGGRLTTLTLRAAEQKIERQIGRMAMPADRDVGLVAREIAGEQVAERIGGHLSDEQTRALRTITGPERAAILIGPAGTGKGVVIDAATHAEQLDGRECFGGRRLRLNSTTARLRQSRPAGPDADPGCARPPG